ncbi:carboxypeptidase-like regulatory domain-containing protein [Thalassoglobus polymorphus]|uniref:Carboxypeptidase regulatory-like domain-containing protein n=1 Tax=Thalassoglobus polymorphus TaxID=2527994 RepID=A0A517QRR2_9PLAN|nr:carboxypeptidase-like regulatory domain-containing protein [Thalassoglobus polymorphus]QDT34307.1 hypothetical protein Mal48_35670 [Thalassoglobus polymorphus]
MQRQSLISGLVLTSLLIPAMLSGCSKNDGYEKPGALVQIDGTVTLDGAPWPGGTMSFLPQKTTTGTGGFAITDASGKFTATHFSMEPGLEAGTYDVTFSKLTLPNGDPIPEGKDAADVGAVESMPPRSANVQPDGKHVLVVTAEPQTVNYDLKSK